MFATENDLCGIYSSFRGGGVRKPISPKYGLSTKIVCREFYKIFTFYYVSSLYKKHTVSAAKCFIICLRKKDFAFLLLKVELSVNPCHHIRKLVLQCAGNHKLLFVITVGLYSFQK